jgi:hypothetical protein
LVDNRALVAVADKMDLVAVAGKRYFVAVVDKQQARAKSTALW